MTANKAIIKGFLAAGERCSNCILSYFGDISFVLLSYLRDTGWLSELLMVLNINVINQCEHSQSNYAAEEVSYMR